MFVYIYNNINTLERGKLDDIDTKRALEMRAEHIEQLNVNTQNTKQRPLYYCGLVCVHFYGVHRVYYFTLLCLLVALT